MLEIIVFTNKYQTNPPNPTSNIFRFVRVAFALAKRLRQRLLRDNRQNILNLELLLIYCFDARFAQS
jgi:hypothetical protein